MKNGPGRIGIDSNRIKSEHNESCRTAIDKELPVTCSRRTNGAVIRLRTARLSFTGRKAKLTAAVIVLSFIVMLASMTIPGLIAPHFPAETLADPGWGAAELVETDDAGDATNVRLDMDSSGNAMAVWVQSDGAVEHVLSNRYVVGEGWGTAELVETDDSANTFAPDLGLDDSGDAVAIWLQQAPGRLDLWSNRYVVGDGWGTPELVESNETESVYSVPHVAVSGSGNAFVVWFQEGASFLDIWSNQYIVGDGWKEPELIETFMSGNAYNPQVAVDASGNAFAVWDQHDGTRSSIASNRYEVGTGWGMAEYIESNSTATALDAKIGTDLLGNAIAVWRQANPPVYRYDCWSNRYVVGEGWGAAAEMIETDMVSDVIWHDLAVDDSGNAFAVWSANAGRFSNISSNRYIVGEGWKTAETVCAFDLGEDIGYSWPEVALDPLGNAVAVWDMYDVTYLSHIWSCRYDASTGWGAAGLIETFDSGDSYEPQVAVDGSGSAVVVWYQYDDTCYNIYSNHYVSLIPEFSSIVVPVTGVAIAILVCRSRSKKKT